ncbi:MAG: hypothetical protein ACOH1V_11740 [Stenotrophomonas sp.]
MPSHAEREAMGHYNAAAVGLASCWPLKDRSAVRAAHVRALEGAGAQVLQGRFRATQERVAGAWL